MTSHTTRARLAITSSGTHWLLLACWGVLQGLSYPWPNFWLLAHVALVPLAVLAVRGAPKRRVVVNTFFAGWIWYLVMLRWMYPVTWPGTVAVSAYMGLYVLAFVLLLRLIHRRIGLPLVLAVPILWVALEWVRGWLWTGFGWFYLGHSQPITMIQIADVLGAHGVSFLVGMTNGAIADLLLRPLFRLDAGGRPHAASTLRFSLPVWVIAIAVTIGYGIFRLAETDELLADAPAINVAVIQSNVPQEFKDGGGAEEDRRQFRELLDLSRRALAAEPRPDLIVWPETMVPRPLNEQSVTLYDQLRLPLRMYHDELKRFVAEHGVPMIVGAHAMIDWDLAGEPPRQYYRPGARYNSAYLVTPAGYGPRYDKIHRVPFGEYIPWVDGLPWAKQLLLRLTPYDTDYSLSAGEDVVVLPVPQEGEAASATWPIAAPICFEDVPSYLARWMVYDEDRKRVAMLVNLTNDGWFAGTSQPWQHEQIARFRCVENRVPTARAVNTGVSAMLDSAGRVVARVTVDGEHEQVAGFATATLRRDDRVTIFGRFGDLLAWTCVGLTLLLLISSLLPIATRKTR